MPTTNPTKIPGRWRDGYALDYHTLSSTYVGDDEFGHPQLNSGKKAVLYVQPLKRFVTLRLISEWKEFHLGARRSHWIQLKEHLDADAAPALF